MLYKGQVSMLNNLGERKVSLLNIIVKSGNMWIVQKGKVYFPLNI
jgi:hypothetical protein